MIQTIGPTACRLAAACLLIDWLACRPADSPQHLRYGQRAFSRENTQYSAETTTAYYRPATPVSDPSYTPAHSAESRNIFPNE
jgi:hypothetical protein